MNAIAADYEAVITTYQVTRLDMDLEGDSLTNTAGIARRNQALKLVEQWAARRHQPLQVQYTLPVEPTGLTATDLAVLQNAAATGTRVDVVNIMTFDDYPGGTEVTQLAGAQQVLNFARSHGLALLSIWAIQRDNGGCPGTVGVSTCSGLAQNTWDFSHVLERFDR